MGSKPSLLPRCRSTECKLHKTVTYIYRVRLTDSIDESLIDILPWWVSTTVSDNEMLYWACDACIDKIPLHSVFQHV
jgi:hypothetical protein